MFSKFVRPAMAMRSHALRFAGSHVRSQAAPASRSRWAAVAGLLAGAGAVSFVAASPVEAAAPTPEDIRQRIEAEAAAIHKALSEEGAKALADAKAVLAKAAGAAVATPQQILFAAIRADIENIIEDEKSLNPGVDGFPGNTGGGGDVGPMLVRLAWHCAGSYDAASGTGGTNGATMRFSPESDHGGNAGLGHARALLEPIKAKYGKLGVTYADIYVFAGCVAIEAMGGPALAFRPGRTDAEAVASPEQDKRFSPDGRLPDADGRNTDPATHLRDIFHRMGFNDREIVTLSGGHALGRCHTDRSGYWGPWTNAPTTFSNQYFILLKEQDWYIKRTHKGAKWAGPLQYEDKTGELMMLPTDYVLLNDREFGPVVTEYAANEDKFAEDFAAAWTKLTELGCDGILSETRIVNIANDPAVEAVEAQVTTAIEQFSASLGEIKAAAKKKGWFW